MASLSSPSPDGAAGAGGPPSADLPGLLVTHGARATEEVLLELLERTLADATSSAERLSRPVRVVVPSASLRLHLGAELVRRKGAVLGVTVQTLFSVAREILERFDQAPPAAGLPGDLPFEVLVRRLAAAAPELASGLDFLVDGYGAVSASVRDLLDAGLEPVLAEGAEEALEAALEIDPETGRPRFHTNRAEVDRGRALVRVAAGVDEALEAVRAIRRSSLYSRAADLLIAHPERALPSSAVLIHGFADATGLATELLVALVRHRGGRLLLDAPPDPARGPGPAPGPHTTAAAAEGGALPPRWQEAFAERLRERLAGRAGEEETVPATVPPLPRVDLFTAPGTDAEAREVAVRLRRLLDGGAVPETLGVVARDLEPLRRALRHHLSTLGVPFSGIRAPGSLTAAGRRSSALLDLLRRKGELPADRWLDAAARLPRDEPTAGGHEASPFVDLRLAFYATGSGRLRDVADLDLAALLGGRPSLPLPVRRGFSYEDDEDGDGDGDGDRTGTAEQEGDGGASPPRGRTSYARRRRVDRAALAGAVGAAAGLLDRLRGWPDAASPAVHLSRLREMLARDLGWYHREAAARPVFEALVKLERDLPPSLELGFDELRLVLTRSLEDAGRTPLGGAGGGVQVMTVTEARGRTFAHLFVVGAHRGAFPRNVRPDPLLPDELRRALAAVLPDVPRKRTGFDEERYLFAQLLSAAGRVTVSWPGHDDDGHPLAPSPLVERLAGTEGRPAEGTPTVGGDDAASNGAGTPGLPRPALAPPVYGIRVPPDAPPPTPRPAREEAVLAALRGVPRPAFGRLFALAVEESRRGLPAPTLDLDGDRLAAARLRILDEVDPDPGSEAGRAAAAALGPFFGFLGPVAGNRDDPRRAVPWVTHAENLAACPWQTFLRKVLRVEPTPDPLQALPGAEPLLLGNVVHRVLERLAEDAGAPLRRPLEEVLGRAAVPFQWPDPEELDRRLMEAAEATLREDGVPLPGLVRALAGRARPYLERAREMEEGGESPPGGDVLGIGVLAAEVPGEVTLEDADGRPRRLRFIADRVDRQAARTVRLTDYKTGKPLSSAKKAETRRRHHLAGVRSGTRLQAVAYRLAAGGPEARGRYLFLRPEVEDDAAELAVGRGDDDFAEAFVAAVRTVLAAWDAGAFFPRVVDTAGENEPTRCRFCEVSEACLRGDSGARLRLHRWNADSDASAHTAAEAAHHEVWRLPDRDPGEDR